MDLKDQHRIPIQRVEHIAQHDSVGPVVPANVYRSANYVVVDVALPRCHAQSIHLSLTHDRLHVEAERHPGTEATEQGRTYMLQEIPVGTVRRTFALPATDLALHEAEARFGNGMLTVIFPTKARDAHIHEVRGDQ